MNVNFNTNNDENQNDYREKIMDEFNNFIDLDEDFEQEVADYSYKGDTSNLELESRYNISKEDFDKVLKTRIDDQISGYLETFKATLEDAYKEGKMVDTIVQLKKLIQEYEESFNHRDWEVKVTPELNIIFPYYNHFEINFSPITKAVYILFCRYQTINIKQLAQYEDELTQLLYKLSNAADLDSIHNTVKDLIHPESKSIYTHISRVKNTLIQVMGETIAKSYIITSDSHGSEIKYIPINNLPNEFP